MRTFVLLIFLFIAISAKGQNQALELPNSFHPPFDLWKQQLDNIDYSDGVSYSEAEIIVKNLVYSEKASGCGSIGIIVDYGAFWKAGTRVGFSASKGKPILIHKKKAYIAHGAERLYEHPSEMVFVYPEKIETIIKK